jgi:hypothetical protein
MTFREGLTMVRPWLVPAVVLVLVVVLALALNKGHRAEVDLAKEKERAEKLQGKLVEEEVSKKVLQGRFDDMKKRIPELQAQLDDVTARVGKVTVKEVVRFVTVPGAAGGEAHPSPNPSSGSNPAAAPAGDVLVLRGDILRVEVDEASVETQAGNKVVVGAASCWRQSPLPETMLYRGAFQAPLSQVSELEGPRLVRWGGGLTVVATSDKVGVGPVLLFPPFRVWSMEGDASAGFAAGTRGFVAATAQVGVRFP